MFDKSLDKKVKKEYKDLNRVKIRSNQGLSDKAIIYLMCIFIVFVLIYAVNDHPLDFIGESIGLLDHASVEHYSDEVGIYTEANMTHLWMIPDAPDEFSLKEFKVSGRLLGEGTARIYLQDENKNNYLVFDSSLIDNRTFPDETLGFSDNKEKSNNGNNKNINKDSNNNKSSINVNLEYDSGTEWDPDDNGITSTDDVVDLTVENTVFNGEFEENGLCTKWQVDNLDTLIAKVYCHGPEECCGYVGVLPSEASWDNPFYVMPSAGENLMVNAQVIYLENGSDLIKKYKKETYSSTASLPVRFLQSSGNALEFENIGEETSYLDISNSTLYTLAFEVDDGVTLYLDNISYALETYEKVAVVKDEAEMVVEVMNSKSQGLPAIVALKDENGELVALEDMSNNHPLHNSKDYEFRKNKVKIIEGKYDAVVNFTQQLNPIKAIEINDMEINAGSQGFIKVEDTDENEFSGQGFVEVYSIDPTQINFQNATVKVIATGTDLYKCKDWNFTSQTCLGEWQLFKTGLIPGEEYEFILTPDDPGFAEVISNCAAEDKAAKGSFGGTCDDTSGAYLEKDDNIIETHTFGKNSYGGVRIQSVNSSITDCQSIDEVFICYEWWYTGTRAPKDCDVSVDADGGISYTAATTTCPATTANPGLVCINATGLESWNCSNFFGPAGTRAYAKSELKRIKHKHRSPAAQTASWDALYFNVTYSNAMIDNQAPIINLIAPDNDSIETNGVAIFEYNVSDENNIAECELIVDGYEKQSDNTVTRNTKQQFTLSNIANGSHNWKVNCTDVANNEASSKKRYFDVALPPGATNKTFTTNITILDGNGNPVNATIEFINPGTGQSDFNSSDNVAGGTYNIKITPKNGAVKEILFIGVNLTGNITEIVDINDPPEGEEWSQLYAVNPTLGYNYSGINITTVAVGKDIFKCSEWDFDAQVCNGRWKKLQDIVPGEPYTFTIGATDPGFGEINDDLVVLDGEDFLINSNQSIMSNNSGILDLEVVPLEIINDTIISFTVIGYNTSSNDNEIRIVDNLPSNVSNQSYSINPTSLEFDNATFTLAAIGNVLLKCADWNYTTQTCNEVCETEDNETVCEENWLYIQNIVPGQEYNMTINATDPGFLETDEAVDVSIAPIDKEKFVIAFIDQGQSDVSFKIMNTNGTTIVNTVDVDTTVDTTSKVSVSMINKTHFVVLWIDGPENDVSAAIYDTTGSLISSPGDVDTNVGNRADVSAAQLGDRVVTCYANDADNDADYKIYDNSGTPLVGEKRVDANMYPSAYLQNMVECTAINSTRAVYFWFDDQSNDVTYRVISETGVKVTGQIAIDTDVGETGQVGVTTIDDDKFAMIYYDSQDDDITITIRNIDGSVVLAPTDIDTNAGIQSRVAIATLRENSSSSSDSFVIAWWDQASTDIKTAVYDGSGTQVTAPFTIETQQDATYRLLDVAGRDPITNLSLCPGTFVIAYTNNTDQGIFKTYYVNGTEWDGTCPVPIVDNALPNVTLVSPADNYEINTSISSLNVTFVCDATDDTLLQNISLYITNANNASFALNQTNLVGGTSNSTNFTLELGIGNYTWNCLGADAASNSAFADENRSLKITPLDIIPPNFTFIQPGPGGLFNQTNTVPLTVCVDESSIVTANIAWDATSQFVNMIYNGTPWCYYYNFTNTLLLGNYNVTFDATDINNNSQIATTNFTVQDVMPPSVIIISPNDGQNFTLNSYVTIKVNVTDPYFDNMGTMIANITWDATNEGITLVFNATSGYWEGMFLNTTLVGPYNLTIIATDNDGNVNDTEYVVFNVIETIPPIVNLEEPANNTQIATQTQAFTFNYTDNYYTNASCILYIDGVLSGTNSSTTAAVSTSITNAAVPEGNNPWYVNCTDPSGNIGMSEIRILTVDITPPNISFIRPTQNDIVGYNVTLDVDVVDNLVGVDEVTYQIKNSTGGIVATGTLPGAAYQDAWDSTTVPDGNYTFIVFANDTLGNINNSSVNFTVDNAAPFILVLNPINGTIFNTNFNLNISYQNTLLNITYFNITNSSGGLVQFNVNNSVNARTFNFLDLVNVAALQDGVYTINAYALDSVGYTANEKGTFIIDKTSPAYSNIIEPTDPTPYSPGASYSFNITWIDLNGIDEVVIDFNGVNHTIVGVGNLYSFTATNLAAGTYIYKWYANDTVGNMNMTNILTFTVSKANHTIHLELDGSEVNHTYSYPTQTNATGFININQAISAATLLRDGVLVASGSPASEINTLAAGVYNYTYIYPASENYTARSVTRFLTITPSNTTLSLTADPGFSVFTGTQTNVSCSADNGEVTFSLYRNGTLVGSSIGGTVSDVQILPIGMYSYECNTTGSQNYIGANASNLLTVTMKNVSSCFLTFNPASNGVYPINVNASCSCDNPQANATLYRDGVDVTSENNNLATLAADSYAYVCNVSETVSYSAAINASTYVIRKNNHTIHLELDGAEVNRTYTYPTLTNATGYLDITQGTSAATLFRNGTFIASGNPSSEYAILGAGLYNYTYAYPASQNYTAQSVTRFLRLNKSATILSLTSLPSFSVINGTLTNVTCTANNNEVGMDLFRNGILINSSTGSISDVQTLPVGSYNYTCNTMGSQNYTAASIWKILNITTVPPIIPPGEPHSGGARGRSKAPETEELPQECTSETTCGEWSECIEGIMTRTCTLSDSCEGKYTMKEEMPCGQKNISVYVLQYPASINMQDAEFVVPVSIDNIGTEPLKGIVLKVESHNAWVSDPIEVGNLDVGENKKVEVRFRNKLCSEDSYIMDSQLKFNFIADEKDVSDSEEIVVGMKIPKFTVLTDSERYSEGDILRACLIYNNLGEAAKDKLEFEINFVHNNEEPYIIDYISPYSVEKNKILIVTRDYSLTKIPATAEYKISAKLFANGELFEDGYMLDKDTTDVFLAGFIEEKLLQTKDTVFDFAYKDGEHKLTIIDYDQNHVNLVIESTPKNVELKLLESTIIDIDDDGKADIKVTYLGIIDNKAYVRISTLPKKPKTVVKPTASYEVNLQERIPVLEKPQVTEQKPLWDRIKSFLVWMVLRFLIISISLFLLVVCVLALYELFRKDKKIKK